MQYIVDVIYNNGEIALFGPFDAQPRFKTDESAIKFVDRIKNTPNSCVKEARIRVLNKV